jgi:hypothetical protein
MHSGEKESIRKKRATQARGEDNPNTESAAARTAPAKPTSYVRLALACDLKGRNEFFTGCCRLHSFDQRVIKLDSGKQ